MHPPVTDVLSFLIVQIGLDDVTDVELARCKARHGVEVADKGRDAQ